MADLETKVSAAAGSKSAQAEVEYDDIRADIAQLSGTLKELGARRVSLLEHQLSESVREKPMQSIAIAAGVGFVFALLMRR